MNLDERLAQLEKTVQGFNLVQSGTNQISGGFGELKPKPTIEERVAHLEHLHDNFQIVGGHNVTVEGSLKNGFAICVTCPQDQGTSGAIIPTPSPPPTPCNCLENLSYDVDVTATITCGSCIATVCSCTGTVDSIGTCVFDGGCNAAGCSSLPIAIRLFYISGTWYISMFIETGGLCSPPDCVFQITDADLFAITTSCDPSGAYSFDLPLVGGGPGTCHVNLTIS